ncbi:MAG: hypothetical protein PCFJNLEI_03981 [Verrucomicrobiae bacterium]|nr:hypothetical protein [Verrucomicrobiae bacterium]
MADEDEVGTGLDGFDDSGFKIVDGAHFHVVRDDGAGETEFFAKEAGDDLMGERRGPVIERRVVRMADHDGREVERGEGADVGFTPVGNGRQDFVRILFRAA